MRSRVFPLPRGEISGPTSYLLAYMMEGAAAFTRKPPNLPLGTVRSLDHGFVADNSKAEKELGMEFAQIRKTLEETVQWYKDNGYVHS